MYILNNREISFRCNNCSTVFVANEDNDRTKENLDDGGYKLFFKCPKCGSTRIKKLDNPYWD